MALATTSSGDKKKNVKDYLNALVDKEGLRTEVTITLTDQTLIKTALYLIGTAFIIISMVYGARMISKQATK